MHRKFVVFGCVFRVFSVSIRGFCHFCMPNFFSVSPYSFMKIDGNLNYFAEIIEEILRVSKSSLFKFLAYFFVTFFVFFQKIKNNILCTGFWGVMQVTCQSLFLPSHFFRNSIKPRGKLSVNSPILQKLSFLDMFVFLNLLKLKRREQKHYKTSKKAQEV